MNTQALTVISAAFVNFTLIVIWRAAFKQRWIKAWGIDEAKMVTRDPKPYLMGFIGSLWASYGVFLIIKHMEPQNMQELLSICVGLWLFIKVGLDARRYAFLGDRFEAFVIDYSVDLIGIVLMGVMLY